MKILLIEVFEVGENLLTPDWLMQPLGLIYLGGALKHEGFDRVHIFDTKLYADPVMELKQLMVSFMPEIVGFSSFSASAGFLHELLGVVKKENPQVITVAGGPHANANPVECIEDKNLDFIVLNEGEITFTELLRALKEKGELQNIKGIAWKKDGEAIYNEPRPFIQDLDSIPCPAWELVDNSLYRDRFLDESNFRLNYVQVRENAMPLFTSRACPYNCIYCHKIFGKKFRAHSPERVLSEIDILYDEYNVRQFDFYDDIFNLDRKRTEVILQGIADRRKAGKDIKLSFFNGIRGDIQDNLLIRLFRDAGTFMIPYAVETASPRLQKLIKKNIKLDKLKRIITYTSRLNIITIGFAMLGFPTETEEEIQQTIEYMLTADFDMVEFFLVSPYFGTELSQMMIENYPELSHKNMANLHYLDAKYTLSRLSPERLKEIHIEAYRRQLLDIFRVKKLEAKIKLHRQRLD